LRGAPALLVAAAGCAAALFVILTVLVLQTGQVSQWDEAVSTLVAPYRAAWLIAASLWLTTLGTGAALAGVAMTATGFLWADRRAGLILPLWVAFAGAEASVWAAKYAVGRARPVFLQGVASADSSSFPSAHATVSAATLGFVAYAVARELSGRRERLAVAFWTALLAALIAFSRVFIGVHFGTDVVGGLLLGLFWLLVGGALAERQVAARPTLLSERLQGSREQDGREQ
jgi:membrane-associated phospholipid phosphatase